MEDVIGRGFCKEIESEFPGMCERIGCPFCSAITCAISMSLGRPVIIDSVSISPGGKVTETVFRVIRWGLKCPENSLPTVLMAKG